MNVFEAMKGPGKRLLTIVRESDEFHLLGYRDGSFGIARNHQSSVDLGA